MKLTTQQIILPILIGLTGASIALVYMLYKKDEEDENSKSSVITSRPSTIEIKIPRQFVPAIIGRGGNNIKDLQNKTETRISFNRENIDCPDRICQIIGRPECIRLAEIMIRSIIDNQPIVETYEIYIPQRACAKLIGKGGETIRFIQNTSQAKLILDSASSIDQNADRRLILKGTSEQIADALSQVEDIVHQENRLSSMLEDNLNSRMPRVKVSSLETCTNKVESTVQSKDVRSIQAIDGLMDVYVSAMETPSQFWIQVIGPGTESLDKLVTEMTEYYDNRENRELHTLRNIRVGQIVAAKYIDNKWYRAEVLKLPDDQSCTVYFIDYGDSLIYSSNDTRRGNILFELRTDFLSLRQQAIECSLANVKPCDGEWSVESKHRFEELVWLAQWKVLVAKVRGYRERIFSCGKSRREGSPIPSVELYDQNDNQDINIGKVLVEEGYAEVDEGTCSAASSTLSLSRRAHDVSVTPRSSTSASNTPTARRALSPEMPEESDLATPRNNGVVDLVTPVKEDAKTLVQNGHGNHKWNGKSNKYKPYSTKMDLRSMNIPPAGYESDFSTDSDELELG